MGAAKLLTAAGGGITLDAASTATDKTITIPADNGTLVYSNSSGNVGIGTSSPRSSTRLDIQKDGSTYVGIKNTTSGVDYYLGADASEANLYVGSNHPLVFYTNNTARARIDTSGNLLVGTTTNIANGKFVVKAESGKNIGEWRVSTNSYSMVMYNASDTQVGYISINASTTSYATTSDYRLKENIAPMTGALSVVQQLKPCTYTWKSTGEASQGFIAHELQAVVPDCVTGEKDAVNENGSIKPQGIDTSFLVATLTAAIQELKTIVDAQAQRITALEGTQQ